MAPYASPPKVDVEATSQPLTGLAQLSASADDPDGIAEVDFFVDGNPVGSCSTAPYSVAIDTTLYSVGTHNIAVMAREEGVVGCEGWAAGSIEIANPVSTLRRISDAFSCTDEQGVKCSGQTVTASTAEMGGSSFYMQEINGTSGIRVIWNGPVAEGDVVSVLGTLATDNGERTIRATSVDVINKLLTPLSPRGMLNRSVGGGDIGRSTKGVTGGVGLRNIGLLISTWGRTTYVGGDGEDYLYIDDGSRLNDGSGHIGLKIRCGKVSKPPLGALVRVTGISSCEDATGKVIPLVRVRKQADLVLVSQ
jgi:hypothetical protein